jgi:ubiquitin-conjugating enzyme E2 variant
MYNIVLAVLAADFITGLGHWFEDAVLTEENTKGIPFIHEIAIDNKLHHKNPRLMITTPWYRTISSTLPFVLAAGLLFYALFGFKAWWVVFVTLILFTNQIHKWQHMNKGERPFVIKVLMNLYIIQSSRHHKEHHDGRFNRRFCILTPWLNPLLDSINFWCY